MDESELDTICAGLAKRVAREAAMGLGKSWRCPSGLREEIVAYAVTCRETGDSLAPISERLGLIESTLARWLRQWNKKDEVMRSNGARHRFAELARKGAGHAIPP